jgi:hypothetical protein
VWAGAGAQQQQCSNARYEWQVCAGLHALWVARRHASGALTFGRLMNR